MCAIASRSFREARDLLSRVPSAGGYFPEVGTGAFDGLALLLANQKTAKSRGTGKKDRRKSKASPRTGKTERLRAPNFFPKSLASRAESYPPVPRTSPKRLEFSVADIIMHHVCVLISACFAAKLNIEQLIAPKRRHASSAATMKERAIGAYAQDCVFFNTTVGQNRAISLSADDLSDIKEIENNQDPMMSTDSLPCRQR